MKKLLLATLVTTTSFSALSAESVDISVIGTISATACTPMASGGGVVDYGFMNPSILATSAQPGTTANGITPLEVKTVSFTVQCDGKANVALRAKSNRGAASDASAMNSSGASKITDSAGLAKMVDNLPYGLKVVNPDVMGLGVTPEGKSIGGYMMLLPSSMVTLDGKAATTRFYTNGQPSAATSKWIKEQAEGNHGGSINSGTSYIGYATDEKATEPQAFTSLAGTLIVRAYITDKNNLNLDKPINLDGSSTIELFYY